jgi:hypothetical protein
MAVEPDDWLLMEQMMENKNHSLLQAQVTEIDPKPPQLLLISSHAAKGTSSASTFSAILLIGGKKGVALVDNGSTDTFMDYTFASKLNCAIHSALPPKVAVARGGGGTWTHQQLLLLLHIPSKKRISATHSSPFSSRAMMSYWGVTGYNSTTPLVWTFELIEESWQS